MAGRQCHHCKQWIEPGEAHDCWTTTEAPLTDDLPEDLRDAWERLREAASDFGDQRIYASGTAIMFSRDIIHIRHRDEVEPPITDWLREAYELPDKLSRRARRTGRRRSAKR